MKTLFSRTVLTLIAAVMLLNFQSLNAQSNEPVMDELSYKNSLEFSPMSPLMNIYAIQYSYSFDKRNDLILGLTYMTIPYDNIGRTHAPGIIIGYRRNFGKGWHAEYSLYPMYDHFYEENENKYYDSFDLWNEFRFGYQYDFTIGDLPFYVKAQLPFGFGLYGSNKPQKFIDRQKEGDNRFFYKAVIVYFGVRF